MATLVTSCARGSSTDARFISATENKSIGQSIQWTGSGYLHSAVFRLGHSAATPPGNAYAKLYAHSGTYGTSSIPTGSALATSDPVAVSSFSASESSVTFTFSDRFIPTPSTYYCICVEYNAGDGTHDILVFFNTTATHSGNYVTTADLSSWTAYNTRDLIFEVYEAPSATAPTVTTQAVTDNGTVPGTATGNGTVTADGGSAITERGICIGTSANPTVAGTHVVVSGTTGAFTAALTGLAELTAYHLRAYATNAIGTSYGADVTITTPARIHVYEGGTDGARDGADISIDGSSSNPIDGLEVGVAVKRHVRFPLGYGCASDKVATVIPPNTAFSVSADGITFGASANLGRVLDVNVPVWLRQDVRLPAGWAAHRLLNVGYGADPVDIAAPSQVTGLAATNGDAQSVLTWSAATDNVSAASALRYKVYKDDVYLATTTAGTLTYTATGLANGTPVTFNVSALDEADNEGALSADATATPVAGYLFFDDFNRADESLTTPWATAWTEASPATVTVTSSACRCAMSSSSYKANRKVSTLTPRADMSVSVTVGSIAVNTYLWLMARVATSGTYPSAYMVQIAATSVRLWRKDTTSATAATALAAATSTTISAGDVIRLTVVGNSIAVYKNDALVTSLTDNTYTAAGLAGFYLTNAGATNPVIFDDFKVEAAS